VKNVKRLIADNMQSIQKLISGASQDGRDILKSLEEFKFKVEQCAKISGNNPEIGDKIIQNSDMLDKLMSGLYSICYDLENIDIVPQYDNDQINMSDQDSPDSDNNNGYNLNDDIPNDSDDSESSDVDIDLDEQESNNDSESSPSLPGNDNAESAPSSDSEESGESTSEQEEPENNNSEESE
jgi:hypothetical protein